MLSHRFLTVFCHGSRRLLLCNISRAAFRAAAFGVGIEVATAVAVVQRHPSPTEINTRRLTATVAVQHGVAVDSDPVFAGEVMTAVVAMYFC